MLNKNLLWVAKQHGHSVEVMLRMYAAWLEGATDADIHAIKKAMEKRPDARAAFLDSRTAISAVNTVSNRVTQIVNRPLKSPEFGSSLAVGKDLSDSSLRNDSKIKWRRGWDCSRPGTAARPPLRSGPPRLWPRRPKIAPRFLSNPVGSSTHPAPPIKKGLKDRPLFIGGEGGIRTHVDANRNQ
jgi:hypothetical protein